MIFGWGVFGSVNVKAVAVKSVNVGDLVQTRLF